MKRALLLVVVTAALGLGLVAPVSASCAQSPVLTRPGGSSALPPGDRLEVEGHWFIGECLDTGRQGGCSSPEDLPPLPPARAVPLVLTQGERSWTLGTADAAGVEQEYVARWSVRLPVDVRPGPARLTADGVSLQLVVRR